MEKLRAILAILFIKIRNFSFLYPFPFYGSLFIVFVHFILDTYGIETANIDNYVHMVQYPEAITHFWRAVWYWHVNPPGLSFIFGISRMLGGGDPYRTLTVLLPMAHASCLISFFFACRHFKLNAPYWVLGLFFFNPLLFLYFKYPYFSIYLFTTSCYILYFLSKFKRLHLYQLSALVAIIYFCALTRSVWHIAFVAPLVVTILALSRQKYRWWLALGLLLPLSVYVKNYYLFGQFSTSSWFGMSIARTHYPWLSAKPGQIGNAVACSDLKAYKGLYNENDPRIKKYQHIPELNAGNWVDTRYLVVCEQYGKETKEHFNWKWSANSVLNGWFLSMQSPADYFFFWQERGGVQKPGKPIWNYDWLCTNRIGYRAVFFFLDMPEMWHAYQPNEWWRLLTDYTVVYTVLILVFGCLFFFMPAAYRIAYTILAFCMAVFILIDNYEANRMRLEVEPFFYFFALVAIARLRDGYWPWAKKVTLGAQSE